MGRHSADEHPDGVPASELVPPPPFILEIMMTTDEREAVNPTDVFAVIPPTQPFPSVRLPLVPGLPRTEPQPVARARRSPRRS